VTLDVQYNVDISVLAARAFFSAVLGAYCFRESR